MPTTLARSVRDDKYCEHVESGSTDSITGVAPRSGSEWFESQIPAPNEVQIPSVSHVAIRES